MKINLKLSECDVQKFGDYGFGGNKILILPKHEGDNTYVVKVEQQMQSINEFVAQNFLKTVGLTSIPVVWVDCREQYPARYHYFGAVKYMDSLIRIPPDCDGIDVPMKEDYIKHTLLNNVLFNNDNNGEVYTDAHGIIYSLDYGETLMTIDLFGLIIFHSKTSSTYIQMDIEEKINTAVSKMFSVESLCQACHDCMASIESRIRPDAAFGSIEMEQAGLSVLESVAAMNISEMDLCLKSVGRHTCRLMADTYKQIFIRLKEETQELIKIGNPF